MLPFAQFNHTFNAELLKKWREENKLSATKAAKKIGISNISIYENNRTLATPSLKNLKKIIHKLNLNPIQVFQLINLIPPGLKKSEFNNFIQACKDDGLDPGLVINAFIRSYALTK